MAALVEAASRAGTSRAAPPGSSHSAQQITCYFSVQRFWQPAHPVIALSMRTRRLNFPFFVPGDSILLHVTIPLVPCQLGASANSLGTISYKSPQASVVQWSWWEAPAEPQGLGHALKQEEEKQGLAKARKQ